MTARTKPYTLTSERSVTNTTDFPVASQQLASIRLRRAPSVLTRATTRDGMELSLVALARAGGPLVRLHGTELSKSERRTPLPHLLPAEGGARVSRAARPLPLRELERRTYSIGDRETEVPFGAARVVNAATLKAMMGAKRSTLFRRIGDRWEICADSYQIDLEDTSQVFKLGDITVYS